MIVRGVIGCAVVLGFFAGSVEAQSLAVTVTPPLFQLTIGPGETWASSLKVVNTNAYDVTYFSEIVDFAAEGEAGNGRFIPIVTTGGAHTLGSWIELPQESVVIGAGASGEIPFTVRIPADASPGGHYAAVLVGTRPPGDQLTGSGVSISSFVSSLLFVRIEGDVHESGRIREFRSDSTWYENALAQFVLRFENTGNTHLQPQGDITIYNMWGKERGKVAINQKTNFGNVLPQSIRRFEFSWDGEEEAFDIGRYSAVVTLAYGEDGKQNVTATNYFWVVPVVPVATTLGGLFALLILMTWLIRRYIRRALSLERARMGISESSPPTSPSISTFVQPIREGVVDLRRLSGAVPATPASETAAAPLTTGQFVGRYRLFFVFLIVVVIGCIGAWYYFEKALAPERAFEISAIDVGEEE
ncbi:MAG: hypothetical protein WA021_03700 [Minisyncoccia bacterium]